MVRNSNESQVERFLPRRPPSGTDSFGNLFRDLTQVMQEIVADELVRRGFDDLRPALLAVAQHVGANGTRLTELAERALLSKATVVRTVDELERLGYVTRRPDPTDGRAKLVVSTARAHEAERTARAAIEDIRRAWGELLGEEEMASLEALLRRLRTALWPSP
jgi:DNA-binding MarR family transcriptional regulator